MSVQDNASHHLQSYIWYVKKREHNPTAAAIENKRRQPQGFMQNILNIPVEQCDLSDFSSRMMLPSVLYASFEQVQILE